ncbi:glycosyltransferase involved in cell wall biosynthesis [Neorhizobium huautlense]|uniref:Glycosyltransferase involved in cell wall biosynthesis n=1 Tax=Neorhizobium huautlense TaxID=67774 RepID=A0ABT9PTJ0_9HYPH|nr:glycosyltransferase family 2 protein [Neorhizobium huautlense]MDP9837766.1 glycosyltransferase involved in cell wall biosynthesis [Neorhizobium huautlense]
MSGQTPILSICVPTYNRLKMLQRNIKFHLDVFRKAGLPFEIVVVDDCSTDGTDRYMQTVLSEPEVKSFRRVKNSGFLSNYAFAMQRASGKYALFLGDDDLLIPEKVMEYLRMMESDADLGMIQAPWMLTDERKGGSDMQPFYDIPGPMRFRKGDFSDMLDFILKYHVFPEFLIIRRDVLAQTVSGAAPFIFWAFLFTTRALGKADVLFLPAPFARVTGISADPELQQGKKECMFQWDTYRGGLEYLASHARTVTLAPAARLELLDKISHFMLVRKAVAIRLHVHARNWVEAYIMYHRMAAYHASPVADELYKQICTLAGIVTALEEAAGFSAEAVIVDPVINDDMIHLVPDHLKQRLTRQASTADGWHPPRAWLRMMPDFGAQADDGDVVYDLRNYLAQFA